MKLLLDTCVWGGAIQALSSGGHDVIWSGQWPTDPGDLEIMERARVEGRILVTLDKDFGELAIVRGIPHAGIVRLVNISALQQASVCLRVLSLHRKDLEGGAIVTVEPGRIRVRPPDAEPP